MCIKKLVISILLVPVSFAFAQTNSVLTHDYSNIDIRVDPQFDDAVEFKTFKLVADEYYAHFQSLNPHLPHSDLKKVYDQICLKFRKLGVHKSTLEKYGSKVGAIIVAGEIISTFIVPVFAQAIDQLWIGGISAALPWGVFAADQYVRFQEKSLERKIAKEMSRASTFQWNWLRSFGRSKPYFNELKELKNELMNYEAKNRVLSVLVESGMQEYRQHFQIDIAQNIQEADPHASLVKIEEIEEIVRAAPDGDRYLERVVLDKADSRIYLAKLLSFINANEVSGKDLLALARHRYDRQPIKNEKAVMLIRKIDDFKKEIGSLQVQLHSLKKEANKKMKDVETSPEMKKEATIYAEELATKIEHLNADLTKAEFMFLDTLTKPRYSASKDIYATVDDQIARLANHFSELRNELVPYAGALKNKENDLAFHRFFREKMKLQKCLDAYAFIAYPVKVVLKF